MGASKLFRVHTNIQLSIGEQIRVCEDVGNRKIFAAGSAVAGTTSEIATHFIFKLSVIRRCADGAITPHPNFGKS